MKFTQDFRGDLDAADFFGEPFAFVRFADGELSFLQERPLRVDRPSEQWSSAESPPWFRSALQDALRCDLPGYCVGISCPCCDEKAHRWYLSQVRVPLERLTYSNLFVNANYDRFLARAHRQDLMKSCAVVSSGRGHLRVPENAVNSDWDIDGLVGELCKVERPILLAAGPASAIIAHRYWVKAERRQTIVDIGSSLDVLIHGRATRNYHNPHHPNRRKVCEWSSPPEREPSEGERSSTQRLPSSGNREPGDITVILTAYRRPQYLAEQVGAIHAQTVLPRSIWVWTNAPDDQMSSALADVKVDRVITSSVNAYFHSRFALALTAPTEYVAVFDDDTIPGPEWFANCLETMASTPGIMGTAGVTLLSLGYKRLGVFGWRQPSSEAIEVDLVGHAWFLRTEWIRFLFYDRPVTGTNGEDIELCSRALRYGGIPSICPPHPPEDQTVWGSLFGAQYGQGGGVDASARPGHCGERDQIVRAEIAAGWRPLIMRDRTGVKGEEVDSSENSAQSNSAPLPVGPGKDLEGESVKPIRRPRIHSPMPAFPSCHNGWSIARDCWETMASLLKPGMLTLECGSGVSTELFEAAGCRHTALEHDPRHAPHRDSVVLTPLVGDPPWYDWKPTHRFDLIFIDGPPGRIGRRGILRVLDDCMHGDTIVVLDDTNRTAERELTQEIARRYGLQCREYACQADQRSFTVCRRPGGSMAEFNRSDQDAHGLASKGACPPKVPLLTEIDRSARRLLHIGCGDGSFGSALGGRRPAAVVGIERDEVLAAAARERLDEVISGDVEQLEPDFASGSFDCVVCNCLAQLKDPSGLLKRMREWLALDGQLVAKIPNLRHHSVVGNLLGGRWDGHSAEALRPDNMRFFTRREIEKLIYHTGFEIKELKPLDNAGLEQWRRAGRSGEVNIGGLHMAGLSCDEAEEFYVEEYLVRAVPVQKADYGLTSIVILARNRLPYTRICLESIRFRTDEPYELIVVDNGSTDGTVDYLRTQDDIKLIENPDNRGFPAGCNQGISAASGDQILLLNNDVIVTTGWLTRLLRPLCNDPKIGLVGPCTNSICSLQQVPVSYTDLHSLDGFAWEWGKAHDRVLQHVDRLVGFCLLFRRSLVDEIGLLDERFGLGNFEDDDYCRRARRAGYRTVIARDAFIHHFGSVTHHSEKIDHEALLTRNEKLFREKWDKLDCEDVQGGAAVAPPAPSRKSRFAIQVADGGGLLLQESQITLSLCMIVRDNAGTIEASLNSIKPWVDEMVVIDTGSKDGTPELARKCGARLFHLPWCDDFSAARNESLRHARGDWIFWMDSDDTIDQENGCRLRQLAHRESDPSILGYVMQVQCPGGGENGQTDVDVTVVDHVKLIRNRPDLLFDGRIHEQILPAIRRAGGEIAFTDIFVVHSGADRTPEGRRRKLDRDFRLLHLELQDRPNHPFALFNLGMTHADADEHEKAVQALGRSIQVSHPTESHVRKAYALLAGSYGRLGRYEDAWRVCREGRRHYPDDAELLFREGVLHHHFGRLHEAEKAYKRALDDRDARHFSSIDSGIRGFKTRHNLALVYEDLGDLSKAEEQWRQVIAEAPTYRLGWRGLGEILLRQRKLGAAEEQARRLLADDAVSDGLYVEGLTLQGRVAGKSGDLARAEALFQEALERQPDDLYVRHVLCQFLFEKGEPTEAEHALRELLRRAPDDAAAYHNLGTVYLRMGKYEGAVEAYQSSLRHRPDSATTYVHLGHAFKGSGRLADAITGWQEALRLDPGNRAALAALGQTNATGDDHPIE